MASWIKEKEPAPPAKDEPAPAIEQERPEEAAAKSAIQERLAEIESAEQHVQERVDQPRAAESQSPDPQMPAAVKRWLAAHPEYQNPSDQVAQAEINLAAQKCIRDGKTWDQPDFIANLERHLGIGNGKDLPPSEPVKAPYNGRSQSPSPAAPRPAYVQQPPAAPPTRQGYSLQTGRRVEPLRPSDLDREGARIAGISVEDYMIGKRRMEEEKKAGLHQQ